MKKMNLLNITAIASLCAITTIFGAEQPRPKQPWEIKLRKEMISVKHLAEQKGLSRYDVELIQKSLVPRTVSIKIINWSHCEHFTVIFTAGKYDDLVSENKIAALPGPIYREATTTIKIPLTAVTMTLYRLENGKFMRELASIPFSPQELTNIENIMILRPGDTLDINYRNKKRTPLSWRGCC